MREGYAVWVKGQMRKINKEYVGVDQDDEGGMNTTGNIVRDAWVFGLIPEEETCAGWSRGQIEALYDQVWNRWQEYGGLPSRLPPDLKERHRRIYAEAVEKARAKGWNPDQSTGVEV